MKIYDWKEFSLVDFSPRSCSTIFAIGCNYQCPSCHAKHVVSASTGRDEQEFFDYISRTNNGKQWIEGIVLCGGEPTLQSDLLDFTRKCKDRGLAVKLDTNGSNPTRLQRIKESGLIDYVAMDVKAPFCLYREATGTDVNIEDIKKSIDVVSRFPDYEFRTTLAPIERELALDSRLMPENGKRIYWLIPQEAQLMAQEIVQHSQDRAETRYFLQRFVARDEEAMIDLRFSKQQLPKGMHETPQEVMDEICEAVKEYLPYTKIRA